MHLNITVEGGKIISGGIADIEPLENQVPEKVVVTEIAAERAAPVKNIIDEAGRQPVEPGEEVTPPRPEDLSESKTADKQDNTGETITQEESTKGTQDKEIISTDKPASKDSRPVEGTDEGEAGVEADVTDKPATDNTTLPDRRIQDEGSARVEPGVSGPGAEANVPDTSSVDSAVR
jgi:hypothetical protein